MLKTRFVVILSVKESLVKHAITSVEAFLRAFEHTGNQHHVAALASRFADTFLVAGPDGTRVVKASDFALVLPKRQQMLEQMGHRSTKLESAVVTELDGRYVMAETKWRMTFAHGQGQLSDVLVGSTYVLDAKDELEILLYVTHQDITTVLRERGILQG
jgi:hypothetical protein